MKYMVAELLFKAIKAWYEDGKICILLSDKKEIRFPVELNDRLNKATPDQLKNMEIICDGTGLHWPELDEDLSLTGIIEGRFSA
ncbi:MAG: DUF2442 domain-containing protein [Bacteroidales bacterium]|nr:DUF2442 domain-containing protein [Bacteroidales bacterium]